MTRVFLTVHRATDQIGGNCIEIATDTGRRIVLDAGRPLDAPPDAHDLLPRTLDVVAPADGLLISHPHQDHYGLIEEIPTSWPVHAGEPTARLMKLTAGIFGRELRHGFLPWTSGRRFGLGPFTVTPLLTDHSAFDAHMLLIEVGGRRLLYSGDFRTHGRKSALPRRLMASPPAEVDVLLMEGTNLGSDKPVITESDLEGAFVELFRTTPGRAFVAWSAQNVDRTVTIYRACLKAGRTLVVDLYTAEVMEALASFGKLPRPGWSNIVVVVTRSLARMYERKGRGDFVRRMAAQGISAARLARTPGKWVAMIRPSLAADFESKGVTPGPDDAWSFSMWKGYLEGGDGRRLKEWFEKGASRAVHIHTSGHASTAELQRFASAIAAKRFVPIHGVAWDGNTSGFPPITRLKDGERLEI